MPTMDYSGEIDFVCECDKCGQELRGDVDKGYRGTIICKVELCKDCVDEAINEAIDKATEEE